MGQIACILCALTSLLCFVLLVRSYAKTRVRLLLWSSLGFFFFAVQNGILLVDFMIGAQTDLSLWRTVTHFLGAMILLLGLVWEGK